MYVCNIRHFFLSFFAPLGPLGLILVQHFLKEWGSAALLRSGKNTVLNKSYSCDFVNHSYDNRPNWTPLSPITLPYISLGCTNIRISDTSSSLVGWMSLPYWGSCLERAFVRMSFFFIKSYRAFIREELLSINAYLRGCLLEKRHLLESGCLSDH